MPIRNGHIYCSLALACLVLGCAAKQSPIASSSVAESAARAGTIRIAPDQQAALGIVVQRVERQDLATVFRTTGWIEPVPGHEVIVRAPTAGFVAVANGGAVPSVGQSVKGHDRLISLRVFLTPQEVAQLVTAKEDVDITLEQSLVSMKLADEQLELAKQAREAVQASKIRELQEIYQRAKAAYQESKDKLRFLAPEPYDSLALVKPVDVLAPRAGMISQVHVARDQFVVAGDPLWTITDWSRVWVRVPIFDVDVAKYDGLETVNVGVPGSRDSLIARKAPGNLPTKEGLRTVDLRYELENAAGRLRVGQAVEVFLEQARSEQQLTLPSSALLWDAFGNPSVFVQVEPEVFRRKQVDVPRIANGLAVIERGLQDGEQVVVTGAESLYGEEFRDAMPAGDDD